MLILPTSYFAPLSWYRQIACATEPVYIEAHENYIKQTDRSRCAIATANGIQKLTVPVTLPSANRTPIREVRISDHGNWRHLHWEALCTAYGMSPFFEYYADDLRPFFDKRWDFLFDYNLEITHTMLSLLGIQREIRLTDSYQGITPQQDDTEMPPYYQVFKRRHGFLPNLSILDLLFNEGPEAIRIIAHDDELLNKDNELLNKHTI